MIPISRKTVFDEIGNVFEDLKLENIFDEVDLPVEDKVLFSDELKELLREEISKKVSELPVGKIISDSVEKYLSEAEKQNEETRKEYFSILLEVKTKLKESLSSFNRKLEDAIEKAEKKHKHLVDHVNSIPKYVFGGFSPLVNDLNIGDPSTEGSWRIVKEGSNLVVQRLESGAWVEKGAFLP